MLAKPDWTTLTQGERIEAIKEALATCDSAQQIADTFRNATRNAIIGYCSRHGITLPNGQRRAATAKPRPPKKPRVAPPRPIGNMESAPVPRIDIVPDPKTAASFMDALDRGLCTWPLWDRFDRPETSQCCGSPRKTEGPYCEFHARASRGRGTEGERSAARVLERLA